MFREILDWEEGILDNRRKKKGQTKGKVDRWLPGQPPRLRIERRGHPL